MHEINRETTYSPIQCIAPDRVREDCLVGEHGIVKLHELAVEIPDLGLHILGRMDLGLAPGRSSMDIKLVNDPSIIVFAGLEVVFDSKDCLAHPSSILDLSPARRNHDQGIVLTRGVGL